MLADISTRKLAMLHAGNGARARANGNLCMLFMGVCCMLVIGMALRGDGERTGDEPLSRHAEETAAVGALGEAPGPSGPSSSNGPRIAGAITTCRRPLLFRRAMLSFRMRCLDCMPRVDRWFAVDDGSPPDQVADMQASVPGLTWVRKAATEAGHAGSLNALLQAVRGYDYLVFIEDDFFFVLDEEFVARALHVLDADASLGQVVFNERYALTTIDADRQRVVGGVPVQNASTGRMEYIVHEYVGDLGSPEWTAYIAQHPGKLSNVHWPHFSLHSGMWRLAAMREVGNFSTNPGFEFDYGLRWVRAGYRTAFLPDVYSVHLGKPVNDATSNQDLDAMYAGYGLRHSVHMTASAYDLSGSVR